MISASWIGAWSTFSSTCPSECGSSAGCARSRASGRSDWPTTAGLVRRESRNTSCGALVVLAIDGLISFSSYPLRLVTYLGIAHDLHCPDPSRLGVSATPLQPDGTPGMGQHPRDRPLHGIDPALQPGHHWRIHPADLPGDERDGQPTSFASCEGKQATVPTEQARRGSEDGPEGAGLT